MNDLTVFSSEQFGEVRTTQIDGAPFDDEQSAGMMHQQSSENFGWVGIEFVKQVVSLGEDEIKQRFGSMLEFVYEKNNGKNGCNILGGD